ncbi:hypothetical protein [Anaerosporobacter sp.]
MYIKVSEELRKVMNRDDVTKTVTTYNEDGIPHTIKYQSMHINREGRIAYYDCSRCEPVKQEILYCMAYHKNVDITVITREGITHKIIGEVNKALLMGEEFTIASQIMKKYDPEAVLSAVWVINPQEERINLT